jgi:hypothetical protein
MLVPVAFAMIAAGCVSRAEHDQVVQQLQGCEQEKSSALKAVNDCQGQLQTESKRWDSIETQLTSTLPQTLKDFQDERAKIIEIVPEQVRSEVGKRLDRYFVNVFKQLERMEGKLELMREDLSASRAEVARLSTDVGSKLDATHKAVLGEHDRLAEQSRRVAEIIAIVAEFDRDRINCRDCKERLRLKDKDREQLLAFHSQLIQQVQMLETEGLVE